MIEAPIQEYPVLERGERIAKMVETQRTTIKAVCDSLGVNYNSGKRWVREYHINSRMTVTETSEDARYMSVQDSRPSMVETSDSVVVSSDSEAIKTLEDLLGACDVDLDLWKVDRYEVKTYQGYRRDEQKHLMFDKGRISGTVDDDGDATLVTMYSVRAWFIRRDEKPFEEALDSILDRLRDMPKPEIIVKNYPSGDYLFIPSASDIHFTRLSLDGKYTPSQTIKDMEMAGDALIGRTLAMGLPIKRILLPLGSDMWNTDNLNGTTTRGTWQESSASVRDGVDAGCYSAERLIGKLVEIAPVDVKIIPGNHDRYTCMWFGKYLEARFGDHPHVTIDNTDSPRKYYKFGQNLIGMEHGDKVKARDLALTMAGEAPKMWGNTKHRTFFRGHFHKEYEMYTPVADTGAVHVITFPAFCPPDRWEQLMGYLGGHRAATAHFFHWEHGRAGTFPVFIDELGPGPELRLADKRKAA